MKPTEHEQISGPTANDTLPVGSVVLQPAMAAGGTRSGLMVRITTAERGWTGVADYSPHALFALGPGVYDVLHVPTPVPPQIGTELTLQQLRALPPGAIVICDPANAFQKSAEDEWYAADACRGCYLAAEIALWRPVLVWLPEETT